MELLARATIWSWRWKNRSLFHFKDQTIVAWRLFVQMKSKEVHGGARTGDRCCLPTICNKSPLLVRVRSCPNTLANFYLKVFLTVTTQNRTLSPWYFCPTLTQFEFSRQNFNKIYQYKIKQNLSTGKWVVSGGRTHWQTDMTKLTVAFTATLRMHLRCWMAVPSGVLVETSILFSAIFDSVSKCPTLLSFFSSGRSNIAHTSVIFLQPVTNQISARPHIQKSPANLIATVICRRD